jgi:hypothetical protein
VILWRCGSFGQCRLFFALLFRCCRQQRNLDLKVNLVGETPSPKFDLEDCCPDPSQSPVPCTPTCPTTITATMALQTSHTQPFDTSSTTSSESFTSTIASYASSTSSWLKSWFPSNPNPNPNTQARDADADTESESVKSTSTVSSVTSWFRSLFRPNPYKIRTRVEETPAQRVQREQVAAEARFASMC